MPGGIDQDQLDRLFTAALEAAVARIEKDGHFFPLLFELRAHGEIQAVAVLEKGNVDGERSVLGHLSDILRPRAAAGTIRAAAIAIHRERGVEVRLRAANCSCDVLAPYSVASGGFLRRERKLELGEFEMRAAPNDIFG